MVKGSHRRVCRPVAVFAAVAVVAGAVAAGARSRWRQWGATPEERTAPLPGDELVTGPSGAVTRAVGIDAPPEAVWPWLVQLGQGRGGMYSYDWLENLLGLDIHSAWEILPAFQDLAVGDRIVLVRDGWAGLRGGYSMPVAELVPGRAIVLRQQPPEHPWDGVWSFVVEPDGSGASRLISRSVTARRSGPAGMLDRVAAELMDPITLIMTRRMLLGIKERVERIGRR